MAQKTNSTFGSGCMILFALPFAAVGAGATGMLVWTFMTWASMQSWQEVPAHIERAQLLVDSSGDSTTYSVEAEFSYEWEGKTYRGDRVSLHTMNDNIGSFHERTYEELEEYRSRNAPFRCYVNPRDPAQAVLYRDLRLELMGFILVFALLFGLAGFGLMAAAVYGMRLLRETATLQQQYPETQWHWKKEWHEGIIHSHGKAKMIGMFVFAIFWNTLSMPVAFFIPGELQKGNFPVLIALIFPVVGIIMMAVAVYFLLQWRRFGDTTFQMASVPGVLGGRLHGLIRIPNQILPDKEVILAVDCVRKVTTGSGKNRSTRETILWQTEKTIPKNALFQESRSTAIPVDFHLPFDQPASDDRNSDNQVLWRLRSKVSLPGVDFAATFEAPVFQTAESDPSMTTEALSHGDVVTVVDEDGQAITYYEPPDSAETGEMLRRAGLRMEPCPRGGIAIVFPMLRQPGLAVGMLLFAAIWGGAVVVMVYVGAPVVFTGVFGVLFVLLFLFVLDLWTGKSRVEINRDGIQVQGGPFGIGPTRRVAFDAIADIDMENAMQAGNTQYFTVAVKKQGGGKLKAGTRLKQPEARAVIEALRTAINDYKPQ